MQRESNARFVRWSDGSLQLLIGNEVLDITVQDAQHDQAHLFLRHQKVILNLFTFEIHKFICTYCNERFTLFLRFGKAALWVDLE